MKKLSIFVSLLIAVMVVAAIYNYYRIIIKKDYLILIPIACEPETEDCFEDQCLKNEQEGCYNNLLYYKILQKRAFNVPACYSLAPDKRINCPALQCQTGEKDCLIDFCEEKDEQEDGMVCK